MRWITAPGKHLERCLFLDRDGVINERIVDGYVLDWAAFRWRRGAIDALREAATAGIPLVVVSNQSCIGRGLTDEAAIEAIMTRMREALQGHGVALAAWYCCPHAPGDGCTCRKPSPGMLFAAAADLGVDLRASYLIGDSASDIAAAETAGCASRLIDDSESFARAIAWVIERWCAAV